MFENIALHDIFELVISLINTVDVNYYRPWTYVYKTRARSCSFSSETGNYNFVHISCSLQNHAEKNSLCIIYLTFQVYCNCSWDMRLDVFASYKSDSKFERHYLFCRIGFCLLAIQMPPNQMITENSIPNFLLKLWKLVEDAQYHQCIRWDDVSQIIKVTRMDELHDLCGVACTNPQVAGPVVCSARTIGSVITYGHGIFLHGQYKLFHGLDWFLIPRTGAIHVQQRHPAAVLQAQQLEQLHSSIKHV